MAAAGAAIGGCRSRSNIATDGTAGVDFMDGRERGGPPSGLGRVSGTRRDGPAEYNAAPRRPLDPAVSVPARTWNTREPSGIATKGTGDLRRPADQLSWHWDRQPTGLALWALSFLGRHYRLRRHERLGPPPRRPGEDGDGDDDC